MDRAGRPRFLSEYILPNSTQLIPGYVSVDLYSQNQLSFIHNGQYFQFRQHLQDISGIRVGGIDIVPEVVGYRALDASWTQYTPSVTFGASPDSLCADQVDSFIFAPISSTEMIFEINPSSPSQYTYGGDIFYAPLAPTPLGLTVLNNRQFWTVHAAVRLLDESSDPASRVDRETNRFLPCVIADYSTDFLLPEHVITSFLNMLISRGIRYTRRDQYLESALIRLYDIDEETVLSLPAIQFVIRTEQGEEVSIYELLPHEYAQPYAFGANTWELKILELSGRPDHCSINRHISNKLTMHFDVSNRRVGFADSLNDQI